MSNSRTRNLKNSEVEKLPAPGRGNWIYYDADVAGFGLRVTSGGSRSFVLNYGPHGIIGALNRRELRSTLRAAATSNGRRCLKATSTGRLRWSGGW